MTQKGELARLGRFEVLRSLGHGAQGSVLLAVDPRLERKVAIKTLMFRSPDPEARRVEVEALLIEARIVSRLAHPNIVTLFDAGEEGGTPYLVFEYVEGQILSALVRGRRPLPQARAVDYAIQVLKGVGHAHRKGVLHRDLKPANVIVTKDDVARIMDFGIARLLSAQPASMEGFSGTPAYTAPEYIAAREYSQASDVFSVGMMLYEMLAGRPAIVADNPYEILHRMVDEPFVPPSRINPGVDERLDDIVLKALAKDPADRFASAQAFEDALYQYLNPEPVVEVSAPAAAAGPGTGTLEFLLRRMRHKSDFPALSGTVSAVNKASARDTERVAALSAAILKDFALTNKLLRLVNSAQYGHFGGGISTVSRAVVIMGFDSIRSAAITLLLFEHLHNRTQAAHLRDQVVASYFAGALARALAPRVGLRDAEEAFICAMFHRVGELLARFYFPEEAAEVDRLCAQRGDDQERASAELLGISYEQLGMGVARAWHLPAKLVSSMRCVKAARASAAHREEDRLNILAALATGLAQAVTAADAEAVAAGVASVVERFGVCLGLDDKALVPAAAGAAREVIRDAALFDFKAAHSEFLRRLGAWLASLDTDNLPGKARPDAAAEAPAAASASVHLGDTIPSAPRRETRHDVLATGLQQVTAALTGAYDLNDVLRAVLETMHQGAGFERVLLWIRDPAHNALKVRYGLGPEVDELLRRGFDIPLAADKDAFHAALAQGADILIDDVDAPGIRDYIPAWYRSQLPARSLVLFPLMVGGKPLGLLYGDARHANALKLQPAELSLLKTLRNQAVLAFRHQH